MMLKMKKIIPTCVERSMARALSYMLLEMPPVGPTMTKMYVTPSNGISTKRALVALRYCCVSALLVLLSFVMSTCG